MALIFLDLIVGTIQSFYISYSIVNCIEEKNKLKLIGLTLVGAIISGNFFVGTFLEPKYLTIIFNHIMYLVFMFIVYRKKLREVLIAYSIAYLNIILYSVITKNLIFTYLELLPINSKMNLIFTIIGYTMQSVIIFVSILKNNFFKNIYKCIYSQKLTAVLCITTFLFDYIIIMCNSMQNINNKIINNITEIILIGMIILLLLYFNRINTRTNNILVLNRALEVKNTELRKIKHDYGAQISYLYGICLLNRYDDLKGALKNIINNNESTPTAVEVRVNTDFEKSVLSLALKPALEKGINVLIDEKCDLNLININQVDLYRILSNIVNNAIRAMKGQGTIKAQAFEYFGNIIIKITNNGPKIAKENIEDIFKPGFTTKMDNEEEHGFGLSIVKELIEKNGGNINVLSSDEYTEFKISLKML